jgi:hypothetical protein
LPVDGTRVLVDPALFLGQLVVGATLGLLTLGGHEVHVPTVPEPSERHAKDRPKFGKFWFVRSVHLLVIRSSLAGHGATRSSTGMVHVISPGQAAMCFAGEGGAIPFVVPTVRRPKRSIAR